MITHLRTRSNVLIPWYPDYIVERSLQASGSGVESSVALYRPSTDERHEVPDPEASVLWDWLLGDRVLTPTEAGVLDLCRPQGALQEARQALTPQVEAPPWQLESEYVENYKVYDGFPPLQTIPAPEAFPQAPVVEGVPSVNWNRVRERSGVK